MCGICGIISSDGPDVQQEAVQRMSDRLAHRGPDDAGVAAVRVGALQGCFGHRRLSVLDLSPAGHQPMTRGRWSVTYNGELYNAPALRDELAGLGCRFASTCDTEVLCWALETWGIDAATRFVGMFSFAATDGTTLHLVRDRLGIKPLFYQPEAGGLRFASELPALVAAGATPEVCENALLQYFVFGYVPAPLTIYNGVRQVRPGEIVSWSGGEASCRSFWSLATEQTGAWSATFGDAVEEGERLLRESVRLRLLADVPLGAFLSGGIDSSLVCALAAEESSGRLRTFTVGFEQAEYDESAAAAEVARHLGTDHTSVVMSAGDMLKIVPELPALYGQPFADPSALPTVLLSRLARSEVTVALSGDGGDEQFFGYTRHLRYLGLRKYELLPPRLRRTTGRALHALFGETSIGRHGKALAYDTFAEATTLIVGHFHRVRLDSLTGRQLDYAGTSYQDLHDRLRQAGLPLERVGPLLDLASYLPDDILTKVDRASMACALEVRVPLLDHRFVEFAHRLPHAFKYDGHEQKRLLRALLERRLPRRLWERPKMGFSAPLDHWFRDELRSAVTDLLSPQRLTRQGCLNPAFSQSLLAEHLSGRKDHQYTLWNLFVLQQWADATGAALPRLWEKRHERG